MTNNERISPKHTSHISKLVDRAEAKYKRSINSGDHDKISCDLTALRALQTALRLMRGDVVSEIPCDERF